MAISEETQTILLKLTCYKDRYQLDFTKMEAEKESFFLIYMGIFVYYMHKYSCKVVFFIFNCEDKLQTSPAVAFLVFVEHTAIEKFETCLITNV